MKKFKERIIEILKKNRTKSREDDGTISVGFISNNDFPKIADEIIALGCYPKDFLEWIGLCYGSHEIILVDMKWICQFHNSPFTYEYDTNELYECWLTKKTNT